FYVEKRRLWGPVAGFSGLMIVALAVMGFLTFVIPDLWEQSIIAGQNVMTYMTPDNARRQRAALKRYSPALEKIAGSKLEQFITDPSAVIGSPNTWFAGG